MAKKKTKSKKFEYYGVEYPSKEEMEFAAWLREAEKAELITEVRYQPPKFILAKAHKIQVVKDYNSKDVTLTREIIYTADWDFKLTLKFLELFPGVLVYNKKTMLAVVDVKGTGGVYRNSSYFTFPIKQAWLLQSSGIFVNKIVGRPKKKDLKITELGFFLTTFVPKDILWLSNRKLPTKSIDFDNKHCKTLDQILNF